MKRIDTIFLCEDTGTVPINGTCPVHNGDRCIYAYYHVRSVYPYGHPTEWTITHNEKKNVEEDSEKTN